MTYRLPGSKPSFAIQCSDRPAIFLWIKWRALMPTTMSRADFSNLNSAISRISLLLEDFMSRVFVRDHVTDRMLRIYGERTGLVPRIHVREEEVYLNPSPRERSPRVRWKQKNQN